MRPDNIVEGAISTKRGFYIGDVCYVLGDAVYHNMWGRLFNYADGVHYIEGRDASFAVAPTRHGDGEYVDNLNHLYGVDAGIIGLVPLELVDKADGIDCSCLWKGSGEATFKAVNGVFDISLPDGTEIHIDTDYHDEEEDDE